jgi:hypothetical protein
MNLDLKSLRKKGTVEKVFIGTRVTPAVKAALKAVCDREDVSVHAFLEALIVKYLDSQIIRPKAPKKS